MATGDLCTVDEYRQARRIADSLDDAETARLISVASEWLSLECGRQFFDSGATSARVFLPPESDSWLYVDDFSTTTGLVVVDNTTTLTLGTDYWVEPLNGLTPAGTATAYYRIIRTKGRMWNQPGTGPSVSVTARWGFAAIPGNVKQGVVEIVSDLLGTGDARYGIIGIDAGTAIKLRQNSHVSGLITSYERGDRARRFGIG